MVHRMNMGTKVCLLLMQICAVAFVLAVQGSAGFGTPSPATFPVSPPTEGKLGTVHHANSSKGYGLTPSPTSQSQGSFSDPPTVLPPLKPVQAPQTVKGIVPSSFPSAPTQSQPYIAAPPPLMLERPPPPVASHKRAHHRRTSGSMAAPPILSPLMGLPLNSPTVLLDLPGSQTPSPHQREVPKHNVPFVPSVSVPSASPQRRSHKIPPAEHPIMPRPRVLPPILTAPPATPPTNLPETPPVYHRHTVPHGSPPSTLPGSFPEISPSSHERHSNQALAPSPSPSFPFLESPPKTWIHSPASSPTSPPSSYLVPPQASKQGPAALPSPAHPPKLPPRSKHRHHSTPPYNQGSLIPPSHPPFSLSPSHVVPASVPTSSPGHTQSGHPHPLSPKISPSVSTQQVPRTLIPPPVLALPPPPPNEDCTSIVCSEPLTNTPPGSPCGCVRPMQVGLRLSVALYTFFPLVSELAEEIAAGTFMRQSQVRIIGANAASQQPDKTIALIDLVPLGEKFDYTTAYLTYERFWHKQVALKASFFGNYEVLYVQYPGLPSSPPMAPSDVSIIDDGPYSDSDNYPRKPFGVDVGRRRHKHGLSGSTIAIIVLSASVAVVLCFTCAWVLLFKCRDRVSQSAEAPQTLVKPSGIAGSMIASRPSSASLSFGSSLAAYIGSAKTFSLGEIEKATDNFDDSRVLGEGGFGRVYRGVLEDGIEVAVKVLKRDDHHGDREFMAEVEMLSRLHHRNLVKLIGICTEEHNRSLVYELIPNGSVESHLHGVDRETSPLNWGERLKIALGAARGLAYLHEDSSPRVIHRDFKSSNILLEHDFTPKVSDFGLARTAMEEENGHISTRVMGTFGYVAPEYAMTGHLLVKSDVYSYGVVLLELLTGRKPVDMSQPPGQENLVAWARPLLTSKEGLESVVDPSLGSDISFDSIAKVAAIASMCVQPEVSHRPFMGEVVQALKLVCNECDETKDIGRSRNSSHEDLSIESDIRMSGSSSQFPIQSQYPAHSYDSDFDPERGISVSELLSVSSRFKRQPSGTFRRHSSSGPLRTGRERPFWHRIRRFSGGTVSEHGFRLWPGSR